MYKIVELQKEEISQDELRIYLTTIELDFNPSTNQEKIDLLKQYFQIVVSEEELLNLNKLRNTKINNMLGEDYELESRKQEYFLKQLN